MKQFNINDYVYVRFTKKGLEHMEKRHNELREMLPDPDPFVPPKTDRHGFAKMQLWDLFASIGDILHMGNDPPIHTDIYFPDEYLVDVPLTPVGD